MRLLIDGYNLLHASDVFAPAAGPQTFARTRLALLEFLAGAIDEKLRSRTTIVFDATQSPPGLPHELAHAGMRVLFSRNPNDADTLIEDLLAAERAPREVLVVSSDHRVQRAARQRGARFIDSESWYRELEGSRRAAEEAASQQKRENPRQSPGEVQTWLTEFGDIDSRQLEPPDGVPKQSTDTPTSPAKDIERDKKPARKRKRQRPIQEKPEAGAFNPFPPGYGEDVEGEQ